jgi:hypothetical protein
MPNFDEISFGLLTYTESRKPPAIMCVVQKDDVICKYGALFGEVPNAYIVVDTDMDGTLDFKPEGNYIPAWVLFKADLKRAKPEEFVNFCNKIYNEFNGSSGPDTSKIAKYMSEVAIKIKDKRASNRDLYYSLLYYSLNDNGPYVGFKTMMALESNMHKLGVKKTSPLFYLYMGESLLNSGDIGGASVVFDTMKKIDPESKIAEYYIAFTKDKMNKTSKNVDAFKKSNPDFWTSKK